LRIWVVPSEPPTANNREEIPLTATYQDRFPAKPTTDIIMMGNQILEMINVKATEAME
jgi:hypothetical protein